MTQRSVICHTGILFAGTPLIVRVGLSGIRWAGSGRRLRLIRSRKLPGLRAVWGQGGLRVLHRILREPGPEVLLELEKEVLREPERVLPEQAQGGRALRGQALLAQGWPRGGRQMRGLPC
jgi:hypothetical protein